MILFTIFCILIENDAGRIKFFLFLARQFVKFALCPFHNELMHATFQLTIVLLFVIAIIVFITPLVVVIIGAVVITGIIVISIIVITAIIAVIMSGDFVQRGEPAGTACLACGFSDYSAFFRAYRSHFGHVPRQDAVQN